MRIFKTKMIIGIYFVFTFALLLNPVSLLSQDRTTLEENACYLLDKGEIDKASELLSQALMVNPNNLNALLYLGIAQYLKKDIDEAASKFEKVEKEVDRMIGSSRPFGDEAMFTTMGMERKSDLLFSKERKGLLYFCRGLVFKEKRDWKNSEKKFNEALKNNYNEEAVKLHLLDISIKNKDIKSASKYLVELKEILGDNDKLTFIDAYLKYQEGKLDESIELFEKLAFNDISAKKNLALIYYNKGNFSKAAEIWQEILSQTPNDKFALINLGRAFFHLGDSVKAQEYLEKAGVTYPPEKFSPLKIPLNYDFLFENIKFDLMCSEVD